MGTATIEVYPQVLLELIRLDVHVIKEREMGDGMLLCEIESDMLPAGYTGQWDVILDKSGLRFRRTTDV